MNKHIKTGLLTGALLFTSSQGYAVSLTTFGTYALPGTTSAIRPELAGTVLEDVITQYSFVGSAGQTVEGTIQNRVIRSIDGTIDFSWRIVATGGNDDIDAFRLIGYDDFMLDADWRIDGLGTAAPDSALYFGPGSGAVNFLFETDQVGLQSDGSYDESVFFFIDTQATNYDLSGQFDLLCADTGCVSELYQTFAPSAVPVPAAVWLFGSGLIGLAGIARRKKATHS